MANIPPMPTESAAENAEHELGRQRLIGFLETLVLAGQRQRVGHQRLDDRVRAAARRAVQHTQRVVDLPAPDGSPFRPFSTCSENSRIKVATVAVSSPAARRRGMSCAPCRPLRASAWVCRRVCSPDRARAICARPSGGRATRPTRSILPRLAAKVAIDSMSSRFVGEAGHEDVAQPDRLVAMRQTFGEADGRV